jgi:hypothetical protein
LQLDKVVQVYMDSLGFGNPSASMHQIVWLR